MSDKLKIDEILYDIETILNEATNYPLSKKVGVDKNQLLSLIHELQEALPYELETAIKILNEQDTIISNAHSNAEFILGEAKRERDMMINECKEELETKRKQMDNDIEQMMKDVNQKASELISDSKIMKDAKAQAEKLITEARNYSQEVREGALAYSREQLETVESTLTSILQEVHTNKNSL